MASSEEREFMVAADMTLYSNPVNRALHMAKDPSKASLKSMVDEDGGKEGDAMIASDMTKYDSPLTKIEMERIDRDKDDIERAKTLTANTNKHK